MKVNVSFLPERKTVTVHRGTTVLTAAAKAGVKISQRCAGKAACLTCKVKISDQRNVSDPNQQEFFKLDALLNDGVRLACQTKVLGNCEIEVPEDRLKAIIRAQLEGRHDDD
jgi:2Fe-2S ferredoxin